MALEEMGAFFDARADGYEAHMFQNVDGADTYYRETAALIPTDRHIDLLDLGCGTGLELDEIARINTDIDVTGVDLSDEMMALLMDKHAETFKSIKLVKGSYFDVDYPEAGFDVALSVQTMHHFPHVQKLGLYKKLRAALRERGQYIETDYVAPDQTYENFHYAENARLRKEQGIADGAFYHYDTPCTVENQLRLFKEAGFARAELVWRHANTAIMRAFV